MTARTRARIVGTGSYVADGVMTNAELEKLVDTSDDWIVERTGIRERRVAAPGVSTSDMATHAVRQALEMAGLAPNDLDMIICGTVTPDRPLPANAAYVQHKLGIGVDLAHPLPAALEFLAPESVTAGAPPPPMPHGWLFHLDSRHVTATHWEPCGERGSRRFRVRLLETDGKKVELGLRCLRPVASARKLAPGESDPAALPADGDRVTVPLAPHEWAEVEVGLLGG